MASASGPDPRDAAGAPIPVIVLGLFGALFLIRLALPSGLAFDDAEQIVAGQALRLGYGPQPPLYTWLQWGLFRLLGDGMPAIALLRAVLLATTVLAIWRVGALWGGPTAGALAAASMTLIPQFSWESQHSHTHTTLAVALSALALLAFARCLAGRRARDYALFGAVSGLAVLGKYNAALLPLGLVAAAALTPAFRPAALDRRMAFAPLAALAVLAAPVGWMAANPDRVLARVYKFGIEETGAAEGLAALGLAAFAFLALLVVAHLAVFGRARPARPRAPELRLPVLALAIGLGVAALIVALSGATEVKERWLQPLLVAAPLAAALWASPRATPARTRLFLRGALALALVVAAALPLHYRFGGFGKPPPRLADFAGLLAGIEAELGPVGLVVSDDLRLAGNFRAARPSLGVATPEYPDLAPPAPAVLARRLGAGPNPTLDALLAARGLAPAGPGVVVEDPFPWPFDAVFAVEAVPLALAE